MGACLCQVKSSSIIFSLFLLFFVSLFLSCADIQNDKNAISFQFSVNEFSVSRSAFPDFKNGAQVECSAKLYTVSGKYVDYLVQERSFSGTWEELQNFRFEFEDANVWHNAYVKVTIVYKENSLGGVAAVTPIVLQGRSDNFLIIRGVRVVDVELEGAPKTKVFLYKNGYSGEKDDSEIATTNSNSLTSLSLSGRNPSFCFTDDGSAYYYYESSSDGAKSVNAMVGTTYHTVNNALSTIKADGKNIWGIYSIRGGSALWGQTKYYDIEKQRWVDKSSVTVSLENIKSDIFEIKGNNAYVLVETEKPEKTMSIKRMTFPETSSNGDDPFVAVETGAVDISASRLGLNLGESEEFVVRDMLIQQGKLYILVNGYYIAPGESGGNGSYCRGGVIRIPLSAFDQREASVESWKNGAKVFGLSQDNSVGKKSNGYFYMPARFIARRPDELVIADDGFYWDEGASEAKDKAKLIKRVVFLNLDDFSMDVTDVANGSSYYLFNGYHNSSTFDGFEY